MNNYVIIHHSKDLDGYGSAVLVLKYLINNFNIEKKHIKTFPVDYNSYNFNNIIKHINKDTIVYVLDFCLKEHEMNNICEICQKLIFCDHHIKSKDIIDNLNYENIEKIFNFENEKYSACGLIYEYLFKENFENNYLVESINNSDIWKFNKDYFKPIISFICSLTWKDYDLLRKLIFDKTLYDQLFTKEQMFVLGKTFSISYEKYIESLISGESGFITTYNNHKCFVINNTNGSINSEMLNKALYKYNLDIAISYSDILKTEMKRVFSLRSIEIDVCEIASKFGGGGHVKASGFDMPLKKGIEFIDELITNR